MSGASTIAKLDSYLDERLLLEPGSFLLSN